MAKDWVDSTEMAGSGKRPWKSCAEMELSRLSERERDKEGPAKAPFRFGRAIMETEAFNKGPTGTVNCVMKLRSAIARFFTDAGALRYSMMFLLGRFLSWCRYKTSPIRYHELLKL